MSDSIGMALTGIEQFTNAIKRANVGAQARTKAAIHRGTERVAAEARQRVVKQSGELAYTIRPEFSKTGMTGYVKAGYGVLIRKTRAHTTRGQNRAAVRIAALREKAAGRRNATHAAATSKRALVTADLGIYAPVVEFGDRRRHKPKRPFLHPTLEKNAPAILNDLKAAVLDGAEPITR